MVSVSRNIKKEGFFMMIRLTKLERANGFEFTTSPTYNESYVYINSDHIKLMEIDNSRITITKIMLTEKDEILVKEHPNHIMGEINK